jgi:hypothetical protein
MMGAMDGMDTTGSRPLPDARQAGSERNCSARRSDDRASSLPNIGRDMPSPLEDGEHRRPRTATDAHGPSNGRRVRPPTMPPTSEASHHPDHPRHHIPPVHPHTPHVHTSYAPLTFTPRPLPDSERYVDIISQHLAAGGYGFAGETPESRVASRRP